jgi:hypothetical protein
MEFHEAYVVRHVDSSKYGGPDALAPVSHLAAGVFELTMRRFKASAALSWRRRPAA